MTKKHAARGTGGVARKIFRMLFQCPRGKHARSFEDVTPEGDRYVSKCSGCGTPMVRLSKRNWVVDTRA